MWKSRGPYLVNHVSLRSKRNFFWHVPFWDIYCSEINVKKYITLHWTVLNHNTYCIAISWKAGSINEVLAATPHQKASVIRYPSSLPWNTEPLVWALLSVREDYLTLSLSTDTTHAAFWYFFLTVPQAVFLSLLIFVCLCLSLLYFPPPNRWTTSISAQDLANFQQKLKVFLRLITLFIFMWKENID